MLENFVPQVPVEVSRVDLAMSLVARDMGVTLIPEFSVTFANNPMNLDYFYRNRCAPTRVLTIAYRKNRALSAPGQRFVQLFSERYAPTAEEDEAEI